MLWANSFQFSNRRCDVCKKRNVHIDHCIKKQKQHKLYGTV